MIEDKNRHEAIQSNSDHKNSLEVYFEDYDQEYSSEKIDWGKPVGNEIW